MLAAQSGAPGRPRTPNSKRAHEHQGKEVGVTGDARIISLFIRPRASAKRTDELNAAVPAPPSRVLLVVQASSETTELQRNRASPLPLSRHLLRTNLGSGARPSDHGPGAIGMSSSVRFAVARGRMKRSDDREVARDADLLALVPVSLF